MNNKSKNHTNHDGDVRTEYLFVNGVPTYVMKCGTAHLTASNCDSLILVIPGNPGIIGFYEEFMRTVHELSGRGIPVWGISHAGHVTVPRHISTDPNDMYRLYDLDTQIRHKVDFIRQYIPSPTRLILVSHSIGAHIALKILKTIQTQKLNINVEKVIMLFPTVRHMALSPHGRLAWPLLRYFQWLVVLIVFLLSYLSPDVQYRMILWYFSGRRVPQCAYNAAMHLFNTTCTRNLMFLAAHELREVLEPDYDLIQDNLHKLIFYYGQNDQWAPLSYYKEMKGIFPEGEVYLCENNFEHAFVLRHSREMAPLVWQWSKKALDSKHSSEK